jgi:ferric-dicitrate binding protein FerR (iron transport regulator)
VLPADAAVSSFVNGVLTLTNVPLPAAIPELDRWYDADIRLGDPQLAAKGVTSEFAAGSLAELTEILEGTFNVRVVRVGRVLTLYAR